MSIAKIRGLGHGQETRPGCWPLPWDPAHVPSRSRGFVESRSFANSGFPLRSGKGADLGVSLHDLGVCLHGTCQIPCHLAGMKSPCFRGWWGKKPGQTPVSLPLSSYWLLRKPGCPFFSGKHGAHGPSKMQEKYGFACEVELDKRPRPAALSTH